MKKLLIIAAIISTLALSACARNETDRANYKLRYDDRPARVTCGGYTGIMVDTVSIGAVERDEDGLVSFIDSKTGRMVKTEGECVIEHLDPVMKAQPELTTWMLRK